MYFERFYSIFKIFSPDVSWEILIIFGRRVQSAALWQTVRVACFIRMTFKKETFSEESGKTGQQMFFLISDSWSFISQLWHLFKVISPDQCQVGSS